MVRLRQGGCGRGQGRSPAGRRLSFQKGDTCHYDTCHCMVSPGANLGVTLNGPAGQDFDLYVKHGAVPMT